MHRPYLRALTWNFVKVLTATSLTHNVRHYVLLFDCNRQNPEPASALPAYALTWNYVKVLSCQ